jgi:hypothetical protein
MLALSVPPGYRRGRPPGASEARPVHRDHRRTGKQTRDTAERGTDSGTCCGGFRPVIAGLPIWMDDQARITHEWVTHIRPKFCAGHRLAQGFDR